MLLSILIIEAQSWVIRGHDLLLMYNGEKIHAMYAKVLRNLHFVNCNLNVDSLLSINRLDLNYSIL